MYTVMKDIFTDKNNQESLFLTPTSPGHDLEWCIVRPGGLGEGMRCIVIYCILMWYALCVICTVFYCIVCIVYMQLCNINNDIDLYYIQFIYSLL